MHFSRVVKKMSESPPPTHWKPGLKPLNSDSKNRSDLSMVESDTSGIDRNSGLGVFYHYN